MWTNVLSGVRFNLYSVNPTMVCFMQFMLKCCCFFPFSPLASDYIWDIIYVSITKDWVSATWQRSICITSWVQLLYLSIWLIHLWISYLQDLWTSFSDYRQLTLLNYEFLEHLTKPCGVEVSRWNSSFYTVVNWPGKCSCRKKNLFLAEIMFTFCKLNKKRD